MSSPKRERISMPNELILPGGTLAIPGETVILNGTNFQTPAGTLVYYSVSGAPVNVTTVSWTNTQIQASIPSGADYGLGIFFVIPSGLSRETGIFTGFTVGATNDYPASTLFPDNSPVSSLVTNGTYPIPLGSYFPRGIVQELISPSPVTYNVNWLNPDGETVSSIYTPATDMISLGVLATYSQIVIGVYPTLTE
jgi:hypothetical protein